MDYLLQIFIRLESVRLYYVRDSSIETLKYGIHPRCSTPCEPLDSKRGARLLKDIRVCEPSVAAGKQVVDELDALVNRDFYHLSRVGIVACSQDGFRADCTRAVTYPQYAVLARNVFHEQIVPPRLTAMCAKYFRVRTYKTRDAGFEVLNGFCGLSWPEITQDP